MWGLAEIKKMNDEAVKRANADNQRVLESIRVICPLCRTNFPVTTKGVIMGFCARIIALEQGELDFDETVTLFQALIDSGLIWELQGSYGRQAIDFIDAGYCTMPRTNHASLKI